MSLLKSAATVGGWTFISRIVGFIRDIIVARVMGAGPTADAFFVAFKLPNLFRRLFAEGAFSASFIPMFSAKLTEHPHNEAKQFASKVLTLLVIILLVLTVLAEIFMSQLIIIFALGFKDQPELFDLTVTLSRITFPYLFCISIVSLLTGVLNSVGKFSVGASAPILLNICMIGAMVLFSMSTDTPAHALAWGVFVAGVAQLLWLLYHCFRAGMLIPFTRPTFCADTRLMFQRMMPGIIGAGVTQINVWVDVMLATLIPGAVSYLYYADRISQFPLAIIGTAIGTALLPSLSRSIKAGDKVKATKLNHEAIRVSLLFTLPAAAGLSLLSLPIIATIFGHGAFTNEDAIKSAAALQVYAFGLPAFVLIKIFTPPFFAKGDTKTPVKIAALCVVTNIILNLILIKPFGHVGLAMATSIAAWLNSILLYVVLHRRNDMRLNRAIGVFLVKVFVATIAMSAVIFLALYVPSLFEDAVSWNTKWIQIIELAVTICFSAAVYAVFVILTKAYRISEIKQLLRRPPKEIV